MSTESRELGDMGPSPARPVALSLRPDFQTPESFSEHPETGKNKKEFHGNISLGFSKIRSHPRRVQPAASHTLF